MTSTLLWCFPTPPTPNQHLLCSLFVCQHVFIGLYAQLIEHVVAAPGVFCGVCRMLVFQWVVFPPQQDRRKLHPSSQNHPGQSYFLFNVFKSLMLSLSCTPGTPACTWSAEGVWVGGWVEWLVGGGRGWVGGSKTQ